MTTLLATCAAPTKQYPDGRTGTSAGYLAHRRAGEEACDLCKAAQAAKTAVRRGADAGEYERYREALAEFGQAAQAPVCAKPSPDHPAGRTGTRAGYLAHYYAGEPGCDACMEGNRGQVAADRAADPERVLRDNLQTKYALSLERYREMLAAQDGRCAICGVASPGDVRIDRFHVDHDHSCCPGDTSCGRCVRGLLCRACNTALGNFRDNPDVLLSAVAYLLSHGKEIAS